MRSDRDNRSANEREIDDFLSQFETPLDEESADINSYLEEVFETEDPIFNTPEVPAKSKEKNKEKAPASFTFYEDNSASRIKDAQSSNGEIKSSSSGLKKKAGDKNNEDSAKPEAPVKRASRFASSEKKEKKLNASATKAGEKKQRSVKKIDFKNLKHTLFLKDNPDYDPNKGEEIVVAGKKIKNKPYKVSAKKIILDVIALGLAVVLCFMIYCLVIITMAPRVNPDEIYSAVDQSSVVYDDEGKQVDTIFYTQNRKIISYKDMPEDLINSFVAIEDKTFWKHHGFNWTRMIGAVLTSITGHGRISGTSTITQQLARNVYLADTKSVRSIKRKVLEMYYASRIEAKMTKEEIIEAYLNTIYLGYGCYGVNAASKAYFSKSVQDLTLVECAALAALPQAPESYALIKYADSTDVTDGQTNIICREPDTYIANDTAKDRRDLTLDLMKQQGYITEDEYNKAYGKDLIKFINPTFTKKGAGDYSYFHEYLVDTIIADLQEQYEMEYADAERMLYTGGLKIYSTMDSTAQQVIVKEFQNSDNFPSVSGVSNKDANGNIVNGDTVLLYDYNYFFDEDGNFTLSGDEVKVNSDGSVTIKKGNRLNIYTTTSGGVEDYSLEFKQTYQIEDGTLYAIPGGFINVPSTYKSLDGNGDLVIAAEYFTDHSDAMKIDGNDVIIRQEAYSLGQKTIQPQAAMVVVGVGTGEVKAMVGGRSTNGERLLNRALNARSPGSSIKPLSVYGAALQRSFELQKAGKTWPYTNFGIDEQGLRGWGTYVTTYSSIADEKTYIENRYWPKNSTNDYSGDNNFMTAIQQSINTCAVKLELQIGHSFSANMVEKFGISTLVTDESEYNNDLNPSSLALGGMVNGVIPLEMALAYAVFPGEGKLNTPICYTKVEDAKGNVILEGKSTQSDVLDPGVAWIMRYVLQTVVTQGIAGPANVKGVQSGGKTGTTNDQYDIWFDGFTPVYAASLWIGTDNNIKMSSMSGPAARLWGRIMNQIPKALQGTYAAQPANVIQKHGYYFTSGTEVGLDKYTPDKDKKEKEAYEQWLIDRESHKVWVVDVPEISHEEPDTTKPKKKTVYYDAYGNEVSGPDDPNYSYSEEVVIPGEYETKKIIDQAEVGHWDYEEGWREGDFKYKD